MLKSWVVNHYQKCGTFAVRDCNSAVSFINDDSAKYDLQLVSNPRSAHAFILCYIILVYF